MVSFCLWVVLLALFCGQASALLSRPGAEKGGHQGNRVGAIRFSWSLDKGDTGLANIQHHSRSPTRRLTLGQPDTHDVLNSAEGLRHFLAGLHIHIPAETFDEKSSYGWKVKLLDLEISDIVISRIKTSPDGPHLMVSVEDATAYVRGSVSWSGWLYAGGTVHFKGRLTDVHFSTEVHVLKELSSHYPHSVDFKNGEIELDIDPGSFELTGTVLGSVSTLVRSVLIRALRRNVCPLLESTLTDMSRETLRNVTQQLSRDPPEKPSPIVDSSMFVNLQTVPLLQLVDDIIRWDIGERGVSWAVGLCMDVLRKSEYAQKPFEFSTMLADSQKQKMVDIAVNITDLTWSGFDKTSSIEFPNFGRVRDPVILGAGANVNEVEARADVSIFVVPTPQYGHRPIQSNVRIHFGLQDVRASVQIAAMVVMSLLPSLEKSSAWSPPCMLPALHKLNFAHFNSKFRVSKLQLTALGVKEGSLEEDLNELAYHFTQLLMAEFNTFTSDSVTRLLYPRVARIVNEWLEYSISSLQEDFFTQTQLDALKNKLTPEPDRRCKEQREHAWVTLFKFFFFASCALSAAVLCLSWQVWLPLTKKSQEACGERVLLPWTCLASQEEVPVSLVVTLPCFIVTLICLQTWAFSMANSTTFLTLRRIGQLVTLPPLYTSTNESTLTMLWDSQLYSLWIFTVALSYLFPYVKLVILLYCWLAPFRILRKRWRGYLLRLVNAFGKWSFVDFFISALMMCCHHTEARIGQTTGIFKRRNLEAFFYSLYIAVITTFISHMLVSFHDRSHRRIKMQQALERSMSPALSPMERLRRARNNTPFIVRAPRRVQNTLKAHFNNQKDFVLALVPAMLVLGAVTFLVGLNMDIVEFEHHGLLGRLLGEGAKMRYSVRRLVNKLPEAHAGAADGIYIRSFQVLFFMLVVGAEALCFVTLMIAYWAPIQRSFRKTFVTFARTVQAWAAVDVFILGVISTARQFDLLNSIMVGDALDPINDLIARFFPDFADEPTVMRHEATLLPGAWVLLASALFSKPMGHIVLWALQDLADEVDPTEVDAKVDDMIRQRSYQSGDMKRATIADVPSVKHKREVRFFSSGTSDAYESEANEAWPCPHHRMSGEGDSFSIASYGQEIELGPQPAKYCDSPAANAV